jgi:Flp pilus assembly protein TadB
MRGVRATAIRARPRRPGRPTQARVTDEELALVAGVACREGWTDLASPPERHAPRTLAEESAVARFAAAVPGASRRGRRRRALWARVAMLALAVGVLGACWWVSPARTAIGLIGAGLFCLVALRRARRRGAARAPRHLLGLR